MLTLLPPVADWPGLHLLRPLWLLALPLLFACGWQLRRRQRQGWRQVLAPHLAAALLQSPADSRRALQPATAWWWAAVLGLLILCGPSCQRAGLAAQGEPRPLYVVLSTSEQMLRTDLAPDRLQRARLVLEELLDHLPGRPVALYAVAGSAHRVLPPTRDHALLRSFARALHPTLMPVPGYAPQMALQQIAEQVLHAGDTAQVLLITDHLGPAAALPAGVALDVLLVLPDPEAQPAVGEQWALAREQAAGLGARIWPLPQSESAVRRLALQLRRALESPPAGEPQHWVDAGYLLLWALALWVAVWWRRGWSLPC